MASLLAWSSTSSAKELTERWGAGLTLHDFQRLPAISFRYGIAPNLNAEFLLGVDTNSAAGATAIGVKIYRNAVVESQVNFFVGMGLHYLSQSLAGVTTSGYELDALMGAEFFLRGLENLGILFETGLGYRSVGGTSLRTVGNGFLGAGIHYYF